MWGGGGGGTEEPEGLLVPSPIAVTATHSSKPNTHQDPDNAQASIAAELKLKYWERKATEEIWERLQNTLHL